ncbi:MAG: ribonuclease III [Burkholderiales bacterium]|nr:ribonuclease III [Burkholderiales bacterium]
MLDINILENNLHYSFKDKSLLKQALTHRSFSKSNNERLEFVGDGVLDYAIAIILYNHYPNLAEGILSKIRAGLVNQDSLSEIANQLNLGEYLMLGDGEEKSGGRTRPSILADAMEAIFAAISIDTDVKNSILVIKQLFAEKLQTADLLVEKDSKSILQEYLQSYQIDVPEYSVVGSTGPDHDSIFTVDCTISKLDISVVAHGKSKKEASQQAAQSVLKIIKERKLHAKKK